MTELTDEELIQRYIDSMKWAERQPTTIYMRTCSLEKVSRELGLRKLTRDSLQAWLNRPSLQPQSRAIWLTTLHVFYAFCAKEGLIKRVRGKLGTMVDFDPTADIPKPSAHKGKPHPISEADLSTALKYADPLMKCWLVLGALCGLRCQEIALIEREDVHDGDAEPWLRVVHGKGNKERDVPLADEVIEVLRALPMAPEGRLWDMTPQQMSKAINGHLHGLGIKSTAHALRHYFGTNFYRTSLDLQLTADMMGHSNTAITSVYAASDRRKASNVISRMRKRESGPTQPAEAS